MLETHARGSSESPKSTCQTLRDVQQALALEHGLSGWTELKSRVTSGPRARETRSENLVAQFLEFACSDHHIRGGTAHVIARNAVMRILKHHPEIRRAGLHTAIIRNSAGMIAAERARRRGLDDVTDLLASKTHSRE